MPLLEEALAIPYPVEIKYFQDTKEAGGNYYIAYYAELGVCCCATGDTPMEALAELERKKAAVFGWLVGKGKIFPKSKSTSEEDFCHAR